MIIKNRKRQYWQKFKGFLIQQLLKEVSGLEIINPKGRELVEYPTQVEFNIQDDFRTLKIFVK